MRTLSRKKWIISCFAVLLLALVIATPAFAEDEPLPEFDSELQAEEMPNTEIELSPETSAEVLSEEPETTDSEILPEIEDGLQEGEPLIAIDLENEMAEELIVETEILEEIIPTEEIESITTVETESSQVDTVFLPDALAEADLALASADGETLDMASTESAGLLASADPYFKVGTQIYRWLPTGGDCSTFIAAGDICTTSSTPIQAAIDYIKNNGTVPSDRKIYVEADDYTESILIDGTNPNLTAINGLIGVSGSATTSITGNINIHDLSSGFTLQGFTIAGGVDFYNMAGTVTIKDVIVKNPAGTGIDLTNSDSAVIIEDVTSSGNKGRGLNIDNDDNGLVFNVTIKNSHFDENDNTAPSDYGINISTLGKIIIDGLSANRNYGGGVYLQNFSSLSIKNAVISEVDASHPLYDFGFELKADTDKKAPITIENMIVQGVYGNSSYTSVELYTAGNVLIKKIYINEGPQSGLYINNTAGFGTVKIYDSEFSGNAVGGAYIDALGSVYVSSIKANDNGTNGFWIDNCQDAGGCTGTGTAIITSPSSAGLMGVNEFSNNGTFGLTVASGKAITVTNVIANNNGSDGITIGNNLGNGGVTINKNLPSTQYFTFYNQANENGQDGIQINSSGTIKILYLIAEGNTYDGGWISNENAVSTPGVIVQNSEFNNNDDSGLWILSKGAINLTNVSASFNNAGSDYGAYLYTWNGISGGVTISGKGDYTCRFNNNGAQGIFIEALGHVTLSNIESINNPLNIQIFNDDALSAKNVSITNGNFSNATSTSGISITTRGSVSFNTVISNDNPRNGATINAWQGLGNISIKNSEFNRNNLTISDNALEIESNRNITFYNVSASGNGYRGVYIDNCRWDGWVCQGSGSVSIRSGKGYYNTFSNNGNTGLYIETKGNVTLYNIIAVQNQGQGVDIYNSPDETSGNVIISANNKMRNLMEDNKYAGIYLRTKGNITVNYVDCFNNGGYGSKMDNSSSSYNRFVKVKESTFVMNEETGLEVDSNGAITLQGVDVSDNSVFHGDLDILGDWRVDMLSHTRGFDFWTFTATASDNNYDVTLESDFFDAYLELRDANGMLMDSDDNSGGGTIANINGLGLAPGDYTITVCPANDTGTGCSAVGAGGGQYRLKLNTDYYYSQDYSYGTRLENMSGVGSVRVLYSRKMGYGLRAWNNNYIGLYINSSGAVTLSRIESSFNGHVGINVYNPNAPELPVTVNIASVEGSPEYGIFVSSYGNITIKNLTSIGNLDDGVHLLNNAAPKPHSINIYSSIIVENGGDAGLYINASGSVLLNSITSVNPLANCGARIFNDTISTGNVTIAGKENVFDNNKFYGLYINSYGNISLTNFSASNNGQFGVYAVNGWAGHDPKYIKVNNTQRNGFNYILNNPFQGLDLRSYGAVTINKVFASGNARGNNINCLGAPEFQKVTVTNSIFNDSSDPSFGTGLEIESYGPVSLTNVWASNNQGNGIYLDNSTAAGQDVIGNKLTANNNKYSGIHVTSSGFVKMTTINASDNLQSGLEINNADGFETVNISKGYFDRNTNYGLYVYTNNLIQVSNVSAMHNQKQGIYLNGDTEYIDATLTRIKTIGNRYDGIRIDDARNININYVTSTLNGNPSYNTVAGIYIASQLAPDTSVTIKNSSFMANYGNGVYLLFIDDHYISNTVIFGNDIDGSGEGETNF